MKPEHDPITGTTFRDEVAMRILPSLIIKGFAGDSPVRLAQIAYKYADELVKIKNIPKVSRYGKKK